MLSHAFMLTVWSCTALAQDPGGHVIIMGQLKLKANREQDFRKLIAEMTTRAKHEDHGNIRYEFFTTAPMGGSQTGATVWVFYEEWQDQAAASAHGKWAGPIVQTSWKEMSETMDFVRLNPVKIE